MISQLFEKILNKSMIDKRFAESEREEITVKYNHYLDKSEESLKNTEISYHEMFVDIFGEERNIIEYITKLRTFLNQNDVKNTLNLNVTCFKCQRKEKYEASVPPDYSNSSN